MLVLAPFCGVVWTDEAVLHFCPADGAQNDRREILGVPVYVLYF